MASPARVRGGRSGLPGPARPGARVPARRSGHDFYSTTSETAGWCAIPPAAKPSRTKVLVPSPGISEWLVATGWFTQGRRLALRLWKPC